VAAGLAAAALGLGAATGPGTVATPRAATGPAEAAKPGAVTAAVAAAGPGPAVRPGRPCGAFPGAYQLRGAGGIVPAAWSGDGLTVPACGPVPGDGRAAAPVYPYPGALWTAGYQCVEFSERYLYDRYGVMMGIATNGDQVAAHYEAGYPGLFMVIRNGTPRRAPAAGDVLSLSAAPRFDSKGGGHTAVVQSSAVNAAGDGTVTLVQENADATGVAVLPVSGWSVRYPGFRYAQWLTTAGLTVTSPHPPPARPGHRYFFALTATGGRPPYRWRVTSGALPAGLALSAAGTLTGTVAGLPPADDDEPGDGGQPGRWPVTVTVTDARGAAASAALFLPACGSPAAPGRHGSAPGMNVPLLSL
jgi:hypothetical protein